MATDWIILNVTNVLKSDDTPGAEESYQYNEAGRSQQACEISSETSLHLGCWNMGGAYSKLSCTIIMEEGRQKSKRFIYSKFQMLSYSVRRGEGKSHCNIWSLWKQRSSVAETQGIDQRVWGILKQIHWTQERMISWNWWCSLHVFSRETQDWIVCGLWSTLQGDAKEGQIFEHSSKSF
jgi:hypothetical protein